MRSNQKLHGFMKLLIPVTNKHEPIKNMTVKAGFLVLQDFRLNVTGRTE
jgi:hypothetical protein